MFPITSVVMLLSVLARRAAEKSYRTPCVRTSVSYLFLVELERADAHLA